MRIESWNTACLHLRPGNSTVAISQIVSVPSCLFGKGIAYGGTPRQQPLGYIPSLSYPVCLWAGRNARADAGFAMLAGLDIVAFACAAWSIASCLSGVVLAPYTTITVLKPFIQ
jgi:hypothetical protein